MYSRHVILILVYRCIFSSVVVLTFFRADEGGRPKTPDKRPRMTSTSSSSSMTLRPHIGNCHHRQHSKYISLEELDLAKNQITSLQLVLPASSSGAKPSRVEVSLGLVELSYKYQERALV